MARRYGRCPRGERLGDGVPHGHWKTTTFVGALTWHGFIAPRVLDGPMNRDAFLAYVAKVLVPALRPGDIVVLDNLSSHKGPRVREMIEAIGAKLLYCRPTAPTSIRSRWLFPSSKRCSARRQSEPSTTSGTPSAASSTSSNPMNASSDSNAAGLLMCIPYRKTLAALADECAISALQGLVAC